jgi:uncharacterized protein HI_1423
MAAQGSAAFILHGGFMEQITLSKKAEEEIVKAAKMAAFAAYTENSQNLMTIEEIALYLNKSYTYTVKFIVTKGDFPQSRYFSDENERPRYVAGEVVKWVKRYIKRLQ